MMLDDPKLVVETAGGPVRGRRWPVGYAFLGIPYAEPPYAEYRFLAPVPRQPWSGVRDATRYGPTPQRRPIAPVTAIPEPSLPGDDVLGVNVFTPDPAADGLPVLVYVHGGGYVGGSAASPWYDGATFVRDGVVVVTVSYRLAFEGFGWLPDAPANRGLLDLVAALEWVRDNVSRFGGDPARVTLAGQSAGGGAVARLLVCPPAAGLFRAVVAISAAGSDRPVEHARATTAELAERLRVTPDRAGFGTVDELALIDAQRIGAGFGGPPSVDGVLGTVRMLADGMRTAPVVDGVVLPWTVGDALARGVGADVPLLIGSTRDEFSGIAVRAAHLFDGADPVDLLVRAGLDAGTAGRYLAALGQAQRDVHPARALGQSLTDRAFRSWVVEWTARRAGAPAPTFSYDFTWAGTGDGLAVHCLDVPFMWDVLADEHVPALAGPNPPQQLADAVHSAYVGFVRDGDPGWPDACTGAVMTWDVPSEVTDAAGYASARVLADLPARSEPLTP